MGLGHVVRSAALAEMLLPDFVCHFAYRDCPQALIDGWEEVYATTTKLPSTEKLIDDASALVERAREVSDTALVVLDGYHFTTDYQACIIAAGLRLVCIDDIYAHTFLAHLVINHALGARMKDYDVADRTHFALGLRFALVRKPFRDLARRAGLPSRTGGIFICLGGADPDNGTLDVLRRLAELNIERSIDLVIGSAYQYSKALDAFLATSALRVNVLRQASAAEMAHLMGTSACGITSPSTVSIEYLSSGGQLYLQQIADNQADIRAALIKQGLAKDFADFREKSDDATASEHSPMMDGLQDVRYRKLFACLDLTQRNAKSEDSDLYYTWASDPAVRAQSFNNRKISSADHGRWFADKMTDPNSELLVYQRGGEPVGQVRMQLDSGTATIGYSVAAGARGGGVGLAMLHFAGNYLRRQRPEIATLVGYVKLSNMASLITFRRLGYRELPTNDYPNAVKFELHDF